MRDESLKDSTGDRRGKPDAGSVRQFVRCCHAIVILSWLSGCALFSPVPLQAPLPAIETVVAQQQWRLQKNEHGYRLQTLVQVQPDSVKLVVMNTLGQRLLTLQQQRGEKPVVSKEQSHPAIADWQHLWESWLLVYWPAEAFNQMPGNWRAVSSDQRRQWFRDEQRVGEVRYLSATPWQGQSEYRSHNGRWRLHIESRQLQRVGP